MKQVKKSLKRLAAKVLNFFIILLMLFQPVGTPGLLVAIAQDKTDPPAGSGTGEPEIQAVAAPSRVSLPDLELDTYSDSGYSDKENEFYQGETVYVKAIGGFEADKYYRLAIDPPVADDIFYISSCKNGISKIEADFDLANDAQKSTNWKAKLREYDKESDCLQDKNEKLAADNKFEVKEKVAVCGNDVKEGEEECDGTDGVESNELRCDKKCKLEIIEPKVTICHATDSQSNPYNVQEPNKSADVSGHDGHNGGIWQLGIADHSWGDIIPPFDYIGGSYPGQNWPEGKDILDNGCEVSVCGDGTVDKKEECDDANTDETDGCLSTCKVAKCGDGYLWSGQEICEINDNQACEAGAYAGMLTCLGDCTGWGECVPTESCGDGTKNGEEQCDDGNTEDGDGCSANCALEDSEPFCGDGTKNGEEQCDDGNENNNDDCTNKCETNYCAGADVVKDFDPVLWVVVAGCYSPPKISAGTSVDVSQAGRHLVKGVTHRGNPGQCQTNEDYFLSINGENGPETNDDADSCAETIRLDNLGEFNFTSGNNTIIMNTAAKCPPDVHANSVDVSKLCIYYGEPVCGDGNIDENLGEQCDDGNTNDGDGCSATCQNEDRPICGDGKINQDDEQCDDGNTNGGDGCSAICANEIAKIVIEKSGPDFVAKGEQASFTYAVTNPGDVPLLDVAVTDDKCLAPTYVSGDINSDSFLDTDETWQFSCAYAPAWVFNSPIKNTAEATGKYGDQTVTDEDDFTLFPLIMRKNVLLYWNGNNVNYADPETSFDVIVRKGEQSVGTTSISESEPAEFWISGGEFQFCEEKLPTGYQSGYGCINYTTGQDYPDWTHINVIDFDLAVEKTAPETANIGEVITYNYSVTNAGPAVVTPVMEDDKCSPIQYIDGDENGNGKIEPGEAWHYACGFTIPDSAAGTSIENTVTVHDQEGEEVNPEAWHLGGDRDLSNNTDQAVVRIGEFTQPRLFIQKSNNLTAEQLPGAEVVYTLKITASDNDVLGVKVTDLPPKGFVYRSGSWTAVSSTRGNLGLIPGLGLTKIYASPGEWSLGDMVPGEVVTLTYAADIATDQDPGNYPDLAYARGMSETDLEVMASNDKNDPGDPFYVGTNVIVVNPPVKVAVELDDENKTETKRKTKTVERVLGASTSLPATGTDTLWTVLAALMLIFGVGLVLLSKEKKVLAKKVSAVSWVRICIVLLIGIFVWAMPSSASATTDDNISVQIENPKTPTSDTSFKIGFVVLDILNRSLAAQCYQTPGDIPVTTEYDQKAGGNSGSCAVELANGTHQFYVKAEFEGNYNQSKTVAVEVNADVPGVPTDYDNNKIDDCHRSITFVTAADSGKTAKVELYRSTETEFEANASTLAQTLSIGSSTAGSFTDTKPDCDAKYYYVIRAVSTAGLGSDFVGDKDVNVKHKTKTKTKYVDVAGPISGAIPVSGETATLGAGEGGEVLGEEGEGEGAETEDKEKGSILGEEFAKQAGSFFSGSWPWIIIIAGVIAYAFYRRKKSEQK